MTIQEEFPAALNFSDAAAHKVKELIDEEGDQSLMLRVFISVSSTDLPLIKPKATAIPSLKT